MNNLTIHEINQFVFVSYSCDKYEVIFNVNLNKYVVLEHSTNILYLWKEYFSDSEKNIYKIEFEKLFEINNKKLDFHVKDDKIEIMQLKQLLEMKNIIPNKTIDLLDQGKIKHTRKLRKNILKASGDYLIDNFGDVFMTNGEVLTGTLCGAIDFFSTDKYIIIADKYKKIRIVHPDGRINRFIFTGSQIYSITFNEVHLYVLTKEGLMIYEIDSGRLVNTINIDSAVDPNDSLLVVERDVYILKDSSLIDLNMNVLFNNGRYLSYNNRLIKININ